MYKVVIIDDEPIIAEGLSKSMPWEEWNCRIAGCAYDGKEGLALIRRECPDIVISDIHMPQMDGLKMIAALKSEFPDMQITILTGYREFEYARQAVSLGVTRFLLKPSRMSELREAVDAMTGRLAEGGQGGAEDAKEASEAAGEDALYNNAASSFLVKKALEYIRENYKEKLRLVDVADQIYISQWHLSKLLNRHTGQNFSEILNGVRMEKAKELLKDPSLRIYDIAEMVGFQDMAHFSRVFRKLEGISANEYRNKIL